MTALDDDGDDDMLRRLPRMGGREEGSEKKEWVKSLSGKPNTTTL